MASVADDLPIVQRMNDLFRLEGKVALVTGGGSGLCRAIAWGLACSGADVAIVDRDKAAADRCAAEIGRGTKRRTESFVADVSSEADVAAATSSCLDTLGRIDILVNGAGHNIRKPMIKFSQSEFDSLMQVHVRGTFLFCRAVAPGMQSKGAGSIINIASMVAHIGMKEIAPYAAAKGGILQLTRAFSLEMAPFGVRVNAISPGFIDTPLTQQRPLETRRTIEGASPTGRFGRAEELIGPAIFLASDASSYVTGTSLLVDGGFSAQ